MALHGCVTNLLPNSDKMFNRNTLASSSQMLTKIEGLEFKGAECIERHRQ
jgi:hypothetical protein